LPSFFFPTFSRGLHTRPLPDRDTTTFAPEVSIARFYISSPTPRPGLNSIAGPRLHDGSIFELLCGIVSFRPVAIAFRASFFRRAVFDATTLISISTVALYLIDAILSQAFDLSHPLGPSQTDTLTSFDMLSA
jgi:hypothetical protein